MRRIPSAVTKSVLMLSIFALLAGVSWAEVKDKGQTDIAKRLDKTEHSERMKPSAGRTETSTR